MVELIASASTSDGSRGMVVRYGVGERFEPHAHDRATVSMVLSGEVHESCSLGSCTGRPLAQVVKPRGFEHANVFGASGALMVQVTMSAEAERQARDAGDGVESWGWCESISPAPWIGLADALLSQDGSVEDLVAELVGACGCARRARTPAPRWLVEVRDQLVTEEAPPALGELAAAHGVHRVHLTRLFRRHFGVTPSAARLRGRIGRALDGLASGRTASATSLDSGFSDQAHMTRLFRRELGLTPGGYRRLVRRAIGS